MEVMYDFNALPEKLDMNREWNSKSTKPSKGDVRSLLIVLITWQVSFEGTEDSFTGVYTPISI